MQKDFRSVLETAQKREERASPLQRAATEVDPLEAAIRADIERERTDFLIQAPPPDVVARTDRVAREIDAPIAQVQGREDDVERALTIQRFNSVAQKYPAIERWALQNPRAAAMASDDAESIGIIGGAWDFISNVPGRLFDTGSRGMGKMVQSAALSIREANAELGLFLAQPFYSDEEMASFRQFNKQFYDKERGYLQFLDEATQQSRSQYQSNSDVVNAMLGGVESVPLTIAAALTRNPYVGASAIGGAVGLDAVQEGKAQGLEGSKAWLYGLTQGVPEAAFEILPMGELLKVPGRTLVEGFTKYMVQEVPSELATTYAQSFSDWAILPENADKTFGDWLSGLPQESADTVLGVIGGGSVTVGSVKTADAVVKQAARLSERAQAAQQAKIEAAVLDQMAEGAEASNLRKRDAEAFRGMMREQAETSGVSSVMISSEAIRDFQQSDRFDPDNNPFDADVFGEASATGGDYVMPIEDYLTDVVGSPAFDAVKDDTRLSHGGMTAREAQAFDDAIDDVMAEIADEVRDLEAADKAERTTREKLVDDLTVQFGESFTSPVARQYAELAVQRAATRAERLGESLTGNEFDNFAVRQVLPEGVAEAVKADELDLVINAMRVGAEAELGVGGTLTEFIKERGGINDPGGDLASMGAPASLLRAFDPDQGVLGGISGEGDFGIDSVLRAAFEDGFFSDLAQIENEAGPSQLDTQVLLDALAREFAGDPVYRETRTDPYREAAQELRSLLSEAGYDPERMSDDDVRAAIERMDAGQAEGRSFEQAPSADEAFEAWAGVSRDEVIDPDEINDTDFSGEGPFVMRVFHGTTHDFEAFDASVTGNTEGQFGAVNYFTSSEADADGNYTADGPDLTQRIEQRAEILADRLQEQFDEKGRDEVVQSLYRSTGELRIVSAKVADMDEADAAYEIAKVLGRRELAGQTPQVLEVFVRTEKPFVVGDAQSPWIEFRDFEALETEAIERVANDGGLTVEELQEQREDFEDEIYEARWEIESETSDDLFEAIARVAARFNLDGQALYIDVAEMALDDARQSDIEQALRASEALAYSEDVETGALNGYHVLGEIIRELGFDSIILKNAEARFKNMNIEPGTAHVHVFDQHNTNIKSVNNRGTFDPNDARILYQGRESLTDIVTSAERIGVNLDVSETSFGLIINRLDVENSDVVEQGQGIGTEFLERLADWADTNGVNMALTPEPIGNTSKARLTNLYKRNGFVPNKGRNKDFETREAMIRFAKPRSLNQSAHGRIIFDQNKRTIELFQSRNMSTPIHELGHMWLEELQFDAALPGAPQQLKDDWDAVTKWFKANGHDVNPNQPIPTEAHELWARGTERYVMEGKAPTNALSRIFENMRAWLVGIYRTVKNLNSPITPEIREVFDRLLATDAEIAETTERQELQELFSEAFDAVEAGLMSEAELSAYKAQVQEARANAHSSLLKKTMGTIRAREKKRYREARKEIRQAETDRIDASPLYQALAQMREQPISREWIEDNFGLDAVALMPKRVPPLVTAGGIDPNIIAELTGYSGGRELVEALIGAERTHRQAKEGGDKRSMRKRAIDNAVNAEFEKRYGDPLNDGSIEREALAAIHSDKQGEVLASELRVLSRKTGQRPTPYRIARDWAKDKIRAGTVVQEASPSAIQRYSRNAAKAGREAQAAMLKNNLDEARRQKQFQMLNNALLAEAKAAFDETQSAVKRMGKIAKARTRKSVDQDYLEQAQALLESVDLRPRSQVGIDRQGQWEAWAAAREAEGFDVVTPGSFEATIGKTNYTRLSVDNLLLLDEQVKQILHLGRLKQTMLDNKERREFEEIVQEAEANGDQIGRKPPQGSFVDPNWWERTKQSVSAFDAGLLRMEQVFDWLDNGNSNGVFNRMVFQPISEAQAEQRRMLEEYHGKLKEAARKVPDKTVKSWGDRITLDLIDSETGLPAIVERKKLVAMALNWGNAGNRQRLADGYGWNEGAVQQVLLDNLSEAEWQYVQDVWDALEGLWPSIEKMERAINGVAPDKVEATEIVTPYGTLRGGYYPAVYDSTLDYDAEEREAKKSDLFSANYIRATTRASATKDRADAVSRPILLDLGVMTRHLGEVIHDVTHREPVMQAHKFLNDRRVKRMIDETLGPEIRKQMQPWLNYVANSWAQERAGNEGIGRFMGKLRANTTVVGMGWRFTTIMTQIAGYSNSFEFVGAKWVAPEIAKFQAQMAGSIGKLATFQGVQMPEMMAFAMERSDELRFRLDTLDRDIRLEMDRVNAREPGKALGGLTAAKQFAFHGIGYMDRMVSVPTWMGAYNKALSEGLSDKDAAFAADKAIRLSQGAGAPKDLAAVSRGTGRWGEAFKLLTMFYTYLSSVYSRQRNLGRDVKRGDKGLPNLMARAWWLIVVPPLLAEILSGRGPEEDEEWGWWAFQKMLSQSLGAIPVVRDLTDPVFDRVQGQRGFDYRLSPLQGVGQSVANVAGDVGKIAEGKDTKRATRNVLEAVGYTTGLVPGQIAASTQFLVDVGYGEAKPEDLSDWYTGLTKGRLPED